jgi:hemerythrin-like metal-binding protein
MCVALKPSARPADSWYAGVSPAGVPPAEPRPDRPCTEIVMSIQWKSELEVNIPEIDRQHQKLVALINDLDAAMQDGRGKDVVGAVLDRLVDYTVYHFGAEEHLMDEHHYPGSVRHKAQHVEFVKKLIHFRSAYSEGRVGVSINVMTFLCDWLVEHIMGTDRQYVPHLAAKGVI